MIIVRSIIGEPHEVREGTRHYQCAIDGQIEALIPLTRHSEISDDFYCRRHDESLSLPSSHALAEIARVGHVSAKTAPTHAYDAEDVQTCTSCLYEQPSDNFVYSTMGHSCDVCAKCRSKGVETALLMEQRRKFLEMGRKLAAQKAGQTHCKRGHEFTPDNTRVQKTGGKSCKTCARARYRKYDAIRRKERQELLNQRRTLAEVDRSRLAS